MEVKEAETLSREEAIYDLVLRRERKHLLGPWAKSNAIIRLMLLDAAKAGLLSLDDELPLILHDRELTTARDWVQGCILDQDNEEAAAKAECQAILRKLKAKHVCRLVHCVTLQQHGSKYIEKENGRSYVKTVEAPCRFPVRVDSNDLYGALRALPWSALKMSFKKLGLQSPARLHKMKIKTIRCVIYTEEDDDDENEEGTAYLDITIQVEFVPGSTIRMELPPLEPQNGDFDDDEENIHVMPSIGGESV